MPHWEGIEDSSAVPSRIWLTRIRETDEWKPLRKTDCMALNSASDSSSVVIEGGRATVIDQSSIVYNFFQTGPRPLCSAIWFRREEKNKEVVLHPIVDHSDSDKIEALYQSVVTATSSLGKGLASVMQETAVLSQEEKVLIQKSSGALKLVIKHKGWFGTVQDLQRGYGEYSVDGEENENILGDVHHVCFVIHGIGEAMFSQSMQGSSFSLVEQMNATRMAMQQLQVQQWKEACVKAQKQQLPAPPPPPRLELIPIEWFGRLHDSSTELMKSLRLTTLPTIPALRSIANDVVLDVLLYLTPTFCQAVLETVTDQILQSYKKFLEVHPQFAGQCSLIGHSLGTVIAWDLLSILQDNMIEAQTAHKGVAIASNGVVDVGYQAYTHQGLSHANQAIHGTWGPSLTKRMTKTIPFKPENTIFLGSPLGIFLTLRGAHAVFDAMRLEAVAAAMAEASAGKTSLEQHVVVPSASPFHLPTNRIYNIFHPSDPVAYRIEPLLLSPELQPRDLPAPLYLTAPGKDVRLHVKARQVGEEFRKSLMEQKNAWNALLDSTFTALSTSTQREPSPGGTLAGGQEIDEDWPPSFALGNPSRPQGARVDYSLQTGFVENEYINAVLAHSSYFQNTDFQDFLNTITTRKEEALMVPTPKSHKD